MADANELTLGWQSGLRTNVYEAYIEADELSDQSNCIVKDGTIRLDRRYIALTQLSSADVPAWGSGWGIYNSTGTPNEQYLTVLASTMYLVNPASSYTYVAVSGAVNLNQSNWWFQQFQEYMYAANYYQGLGRKKLAPGTNGTGDWSLIAPPPTPASAAVYANAGNSYTPESFVNSTCSAVCGITTYDSGLDAWKIHYNNPGTYSVTITFSTSPDRRPNWQYRDLIQQPIQYKKDDVGGLIGAISPLDNVQIFVREASGEVAATPWRQSSTTVPMLRLHNIARDNRDQVTSMRYVFTVSQSSGTVTVQPPNAGYVWMSLDTQTQVGDAYPNLNPLIYEYTYYNSVTGLESAPSPQAIVPVSNQNSYAGNWFFIYPNGVLGANPVSSGIADKIRIYRVVTEGGVSTRYRIDEVSNIAFTLTTDKYPVDVVKAFPTSAVATFPGSGITALGVWQNRLVQAKGPLVYISRLGKPLEYEPTADDGGSFDPSSPTQGLTYYPDDRRGEDIIAVVGQTALYMVSRYSVRCLIGNTGDPTNWRNYKLPDSEGACGPRAVAPYKEGILFLTPSGRLLFHHISLPEPQLVSEKVHPRIDNAGIKALATSGAVVTVWPEGEIAIYSGTSYMILDIYGRWRKGTLTHGVESALSITGYLPRWIGSNGKFYEGYDDTYVSDGGTTGTNGTAVTWYATTKKVLQQRAAVTNIFWGDSTPVSGSSYPNIDIISDRGTVNVTKLDNKKNVNAKTAPNAGFAVKFKIYGDKDTIIETCRVELLPLSQTRHQ
jgi:hypothetical protein